MQAVKDDRSADTLAPRALGRMVNFVADYLFVGAGIGVSVAVFSGGKIDAVIERIGAAVMIEEVVLDGTAVARAKPTDVVGVEELRSAESVIRALRASLLLPAAAGLEFPTYIPF